MGGLRRRAKSASSSELREQLEMGGGCLKHMYGNAPSMC